VEPERGPKRSRRGSLIAPEEPGEQISREEFQELVRDLDVEGKPAAAGTGRRPAGAGVVERAPAAEPEQDVQPRPDPAADLTPEDLVLKQEPKRAEKRKRPRNRRHGRSR
jgi:hypothetical protein